MKTLILGVCLVVALSMQGCVAYGEPVGGYYSRGGGWYYHDAHGKEWGENHRYHHPAEQHAPEEHHDDHR